MQWVFRLMLLLEFASLGISGSGERVTHSYKLSKLQFSVLVAHASHTRASLLGVSSHYLVLLFLMHRLPHIIGSL